MKLILITPLLALVLTVGCMKTVSAPVPGSANTFDSQTYVSLVATDNVIQSTKAALSQGQFPASIAGNVKTALNALITAYDVADPIYQAYHTAAMAGTATPAQQNAVINAMANVNTATVTLTTAQGGK